MILPFKKVRFNECYGNSSKLDRLKRNTHVSNIFIACKHAKRRQLSATAFKMSSTASTWLFHMPNKIDRSTKLKSSARGILKNALPGLEFAIYKQTFFFLVLKMKRMRRTVPKVKQKKANSNFKVVLPQRPKNLNYCQKRSAAQVNCSSEWTPLAKLRFFAAFSTTNCFRAFYLWIGHCIIDL